MALRTFNSVGGFSVGENSQQIISKDGNITAVEANVSGNLNATGNVNAANVIIVSTLTAPLVDGVIVANSASQPNIHTVGNLTNLVVDGNVSVGGNVEIIGNLLGSNAAFVNLDISGNLTGIDLVNSDVANIVQLNAQILDDPGGDPGFEDVPVDGGLTVLLVAGVGLACRKLKSRDTSRRVFQKL
jgi:hypothetical protein